ncbi:hypothetical protein N7E01_09675 [Neopusillimonas aromaticivorans]|nr:hypothetical protein [Neopusillimonas aromaticivorans]WJJ92617.1 hypothetical protein N7E01_09675 [Neopusillimonas aromaticivorans]
MLCLCVGSRFIQAQLAAVVVIPVIVQIKHGRDFPVGAVAVLVKVPAVAIAAVVACQVEFFAAQAKVVLLVQGLAKFGQKAGEGMGVEGEVLKSTQQMLSPRIFGLFCRLACFPMVAS